MPSLAAAKRTSESFKQFRLIIGREILGNHSYILDAQGDMPCCDYVAELLDEYAIRFLVEWLLTKIASTVYVSYGEPEQKRFQSGVISLLETLRLYPFLNTDAIEVVDGVKRKANLFLDQAFEPVAELPGALYEHIVNRPLTVSADGSVCILPDIQNQDKRRLVGQFYTPPHIVQRCYQSIDQADSNKFMSAFQELAEAAWEADGIAIRTARTHLPRMLDPACGTGNFLVGALRFFATRMKAKFSLVKFAQHSLFGMELDARAAGMARIAILLELAFLSEGGVSLDDCEQALDNLTKHVIVADTVLTTVWAGEADGETRWWLNLDSFDLVITNPPYVSFGSRNQPDLPASQAAFLRLAFSAGAEYKIRSHSIFQDIALRYCRAGGRVVLLVPDSFLTGSFYERLRKLILEKSSIVGLTELPDDTISGAVVGRWCIADYRKKEYADLATDYRVRLTTYCEGDFPSSHCAPITTVISPRKSRFRIILNTVEEEIWKLMDDCQSLGSRLRGHTGLRSRIGQKSIIAEKCLGSSWKRGIKSGGQVLPFAVGWDGTWLLVDQTVLFSGGFDEAVISFPKLLVRQTGDRLVAAVDQEGLYHLNNVHSFSAAKLRVVSQEAPFDLDLAAGLMNSSLWLYLYQCATRERGRPLAQIDIETVEGMPLPDLCRETVWPIAALSEACRFVDDKIQPILLRSIDRLVYDLYRLPDYCVEYIETYCLGTNAKNVASHGELPSLESSRHRADTIGSATVRSCDPQLLDNSRCGAGKQQKVLGSQRERS